MRFLPDQQLSPFLHLLTLFGDLHGPKLNDAGVTVFGPVRHPDEVLLDYRRTLIPPKKYLFPSRETTLAWTPETGYRSVPVPDDNTVIFGIHPCDLAGIAYLDRVFLGIPPDPSYESRRTRLILVGLSCEPDDFCFCGSIGDSSLEKGDLFLTRCESGFFITSSTARGNDILKQALPLTEARKKRSHRPKVSERNKQIRTAVARGETFDDSPLWDDFARRCLSCGACSLCCPTCYCFDVREYVQLDGKNAFRLREWDNCLFRSHGEVAGGHNFRQARVQRFHYRYQHKYLGFGPTRGILSCVGCGRCRAVCPVDIDLLRLFSEGTQNE